MISSTTTLPDADVQTHENGLEEYNRLATLLNIVGVVLFFLGFVLLVSFIGRARPELSSSTLTIIFDLSMILGLLVLVALTMVVHEFLHGFFFRVFTHSRPVYALPPGYADAAAPDWFIPIRDYWIIGLAPLVLLDAIGLLLILLAPGSWILTIVWIVALNTAGSIGDILITVQLPGCPQPPDKGHR